MIGAPSRARRVLRLLLGDAPKTLSWLLVPTGLAVALDLALRWRAVLGWALQGKAIWASSMLISAAFWALPLWVAGRFVRVRAAVLGLWVLPIATMAFGGQTLYFRVFNAYMGRDTLRLGIALRGTIRDWLTAWSSPLLLSGMVVFGIAVTLLAGRGARRFGSPGAVPWLLPVTFLASLGCLWNDAVDSRFLQASTPDACFLNGALHAVRAVANGTAGVHQGYSMRSPTPLPPLKSARARPPNVILVLTESVRADSLCSDPPPACVAPFLDAVAADRVSLGKVTTPTPNTFSASMVLWTGMPANIDFRGAHSAPVLWEIARAVGYRTAYFSSQNPSYEDFGAFTRRAGIDVIVTAAELGDMAQEQLGAPDERALEAARKYLETASPDVPSFTVVHLSNTHSPYRTEPDLEPFAPHSRSPVGSGASFYAHYRNAVLLQERSLASFVKAVRALPTWDDTALLLTADHGEQFREHGGLYHNHSLFDVELRVPGFAIGGPRGLTAEAREAIGRYAGRRTSLQDVNATVIDLFGIETRKALPFGDRAVGRSLVRPRERDPIMLLATSTAVWEPDDARFGVMLGEHALLGAPGAAWTCFDMTVDPAQAVPLPASACGLLVGVAQREFPAAYR
jgi:glucan phosphoethanolaminetransferase (alkaline phosphatase superfamily)